MWLYDQVSDGSCDVSYHIVMVAPLARGKYYGCLGTSEVTLKTMDKFDLFLTITKHSKARTIRFFPYDMLYLGV